MLHIGKLIKERLEECGMSIACLAQKMGCSEAGACKLLERSTIDTKLLERISILLDCNFFLLYSEEVKKDLLQANTDKGKP